jgi:hypothetical protein
MAGSFLPARKPKAQLKAPKVMSEEESRALVEAASQGRLIAISVTDSESDSEGDKAQKKQGGGGDKKGPGRGSGGSSHTGLSGVGVKALNAVAWATALQASRDLMQTATLTSVFVATGGNLAASFAGEDAVSYVESTYSFIVSEQAACPGVENNWLGLLQLSWMSQSAYGLSCAHPLAHSQGKQHARAFTCWPPAHMQLPW